MSPNTCGSIDVASTNWSLGTPLSPYTTKPDTRASNAKISLCSSTFIASSFLLSFVYYLSILENYISLAWWAMSGLWVTMIMLRPSLFSWWNRPRISLPVFWSILPVGHLQESMRRMTRARAIATLCCSPPLNWLGLCSVLSLTPLS